MEENFGIQARRGVRAARAAKERAQKRKRFLYIILIVLVILGIVATPKIVNMFNAGEETVAENPQHEPVQETPVVTEEPPKKTSEEIVDVSYMPGSVRGYSIIGEISIEKIGISQYIKNSSTNDAIKEGVGLFWGPNINEPGNLCLAGHDFKNIFYD